MARPSCGTNIPGGTPNTTAIVTGVASAVFTIAGMAKTIFTIIKEGAPAAASYPMVAAVVAAVIVVAVVIYFAVERCNQHPDGVHGCMAGVIEMITPAFTGTWDSVFAFTSPHDRVDVVVKRDYWDFIDARSDHVFCSQADDSPMIPCFYYTPAVCNAGIGASVGAVAGAVGGLIIAAIAVAAIGCATWILCIFALIVALLIAVAAAILGAVAGGEIGRAATSQPGPMSSGSDLIPPQPLVVGDYVTEQGNLLKSGDLENALVFYFVEKTILHGHSRSSPSYSHTDPDTNLQPDGCPPPDTPPIK